MMKPSNEHLYMATARNRRYIADVLETLTEDQWTQNSLCTGWTVRHVAAHLLQYVYVSFAQFFLVSLRYRGNTDATVDHFARQLAQQDSATLIHTLRQHADDHVNPFRVGPWGPFAETCIHLRDIARPLNLNANVPTQDWDHLLSYLLSPGAASSITNPARSTGVTFIATDTGLRHGHGPPVSGPAEALCMVLAGRNSALADLTGPGVETLRSR